MTPSFGPGSRERHERLAREAGADVRVAEARLARARRRHRRRPRGARHTASPVRRVTRAMHTRNAHELAGARSDDAASRSSRSRACPRSRAATTSPRSSPRERRRRAGCGGRRARRRAQDRLQGRGRRRRSRRRSRPTARARFLADEHGKDPRAVQVVLDESAAILRAERGVLICRTRHGFVCANAGVDASNAGAEDRVVTLPSDPDASARALRAALPGPPAVVIADSFGRAWRHGQCDVAIGIAGPRAARRLARPRRTRTAVSCTRPGSPSPTRPPRRPISCATRPRACRRRSCAGWPATSPPTTALALRRSCARRPKTSSAEIARTARTRPGSAPQDQVRRPKNRS